MEMKRIFGSLDPFMEFGDVLGRKVANVTFLSALMAADPFDEYHFYLGSESECENFRGQADEYFPAQASRLQAMVRAELPSGLAGNSYHVFHLSDCISHQPKLARVRNAYSRECFPITGVTHSLSYAHYGPAFLAHLWPGATKRDCIVCTSRTGKEVVRRSLDSLRQGYGLSEATHPGPTLRRVPLAVDENKITPATSDEKAAARNRLALSKDKAVLLVFGRISHYSKMDLMPLLRAMDRAKATGMEPGSYTLAFAGWTEDGESYHEAITGLAASMGIDARVFARPDEAEKMDLFRAADMFISIADNPQETFGITIIEAMAAGLPVVASKYDGYRDLVTDGETGLLVDTFTPDQTEDIDAMAPLLFDSDSHLLLAQQTVVDVPALAAAISRLHGSQQLREFMGQAGRARVEARYGWSRVIEDYVSLWEELWTLPTQTEATPHPMEMQYGDLFGHYADNVSADMMLHMSAFGEKVYRGAALPVIYPGVSQHVDMDKLKKLLFSARKPLSMQDMLARSVAMDESTSASARFLILWAIKHDLLERVS